MNLEELRKIFIRIISNGIFAGMNSSIIADKLLPIEIGGEVIKETIIEWRKVSTTIPVPACPNCLVYQPVICNYEGREVIVTYMLIGNRMIEIEKNHSNNREIKYKNEPCDGI